MPEQPSTSGTTPKLYGELASWWPLLSHPDEYREEAGFYLATLREACAHDLHTVLELGSGGGNNASHMKQACAMTLVEPSAHMLAVSRALNPECEHVQGDMRTVRLERQFDGVFVHDAVAYMTTADDLRRAMETAYDHTRPGGAALFAPDHVAETFRPSTDHGGHDGIGRSLRYLEWTWDPDPADSTYTVDYVCVMRDAEGAVQVEHDRHIEGLFAREMWMDSLRDVGFQPECIPFHHSELPDDELEVFVGRRPVHTP